ncbi:MAG TPA: hypothetical protein VK724_24965 [Bryobacteraceae bacterium]|nr:hypothetical protein [Bryobacteraceae bacterium]
MTKFTRRELAAGLATSSVLLVRAQGQPAPAPLPATPDEELKATRAQLRDAADQLDKFPLPMSTEPATTFHP